MASRCQWKGAHTIGSHRSPTPSARGATPWLSEPRGISWCFELRTAVVAVVAKCWDGQFPRAAVPIQVPGADAHISGWELGRLSRRRRGSRVGSLGRCRCRCRWVVSLPLPAASRTWAAVNSRHGLDMARPRTRALTTQPCPSCRCRLSTTPRCRCYWWPISKIQLLEGKLGSVSSLGDEEESRSPSIVPRHCLTLPSTETPGTTMSQDNIKTPAKAEISEFALW